MTNLVCYVVLTDENGPATNQRVDVYVGTDAVSAVKNMMRCHFGYDNINVDKTNIDRVTDIEQLVNAGVTILPMLTWGDLVCQTGRPEYAVMKQKVMAAIR